MAFDVGGRRVPENGAGISGEVLGDRDGTALREGVKSVLRDSSSELPLAVIGLFRFDVELSSPPLRNLPILQRRLELIPSKWVRKSLFSMAEATMMGRGFRTGGAGYPYVLLVEETD